MNIEALCNYQRAYQELENFQKKYNSSETQVEYNRIKNERDKLKARIGELSNQINDQLKTLTEDKNEYKKIEQEVSEILSEDFTELDEPGLEFFLKKLNDYLEKVVKIKSNTQKDNNAITVTIGIVQDAVINFNRINKKRDELKAKKEEKDKTEVMPKLQEITNRANEIKKELTESELALFEETRKALKSNMVLVPLSGNACPLCSEELSGVELDNINKDGYVKCPKCGRIVYKK